MESEMKRRRLKKSIRNALSIIAQVLITIGIALGFMLMYVYAVVDYQEQEEARIQHYFETGEYQLND